MTTESTSTMHASQALKESGCSGKEQAEALVSALAHAVKNVQPQE